MEIGMQLRTLMLAVALAAQSAPVLSAPGAAQAPSIDLHATMVRNLAGSCRLDPERLARFQPRMIVVHAVIDQTSLPSGWARAKVLRPLLGGIRVGSLLPLSSRRQSPGGAHGAHLVEGKEYLISMYRYQNIYVVDRALECKGQV